MACIPREPLRAEEPLAYFSALSAPKVRALSSQRDASTKSVLEQMYEYYSAQ